MSFEIHQSFMVGYVRRINLATFNVAIGGVRIGEARYTRLAQINLKSRIITFSRFAIENVPERGRRYLVIHELAHVHEADHNKRFWQLVAEHEPNYRDVGKELGEAFHRNVRADRLRQSGVIHKPGAATMPPPDLLTATTLSHLQSGSTVQDASDLPEFDHPDSGEGTDCFDCYEDEFGGWVENTQGVICGGGIYE